jgi:hypothetical protein
MLDAVTPQPQSNLLSRLPLEIRQAVYSYLWQSVGLKHHIFEDQRGQRGRSPCLIDHQGQDERQAMAGRAADRSLIGHGHYFENPELWRLLASPWGNHWLCKRLAPDLESKKVPGQFLAMLLCCKQMYTFSNRTNSANPTDTYLCRYMECLDSIPSHVTFVFTSIQTSYNLISRLRTPIFRNARQIVFSWSIIPDDMDAGMFSTPEHPYRASLWQAIWVSLNTLPYIQSIYLWLESDIGYYVNKPMYTAASYACISRELADKLTINLPSILHGAAQLVNELETGGERHFTLEWREVSRFRPTAQSNLLNGSYSITDLVQLMNAHGLVT